MSGKKNILIASAISAAAFAFYAYTLCPTVYWGDCGELSLSGWHLGIAHPPGYALYSLLLHIWMRSLALVSAAIEPVYWSNLFSAFCGAVSAGLMYIFLFEILEMFGGDATFQSSSHFAQEASAKCGSPPAQRGGESGREKQKELISAAGAVYLMFCKDFWAQCTRTEVYGLLILLTLISLILAVKFVRTGLLNFLYLCMFFSALALTHHLTFIFTFAGIIAFILFSKPYLFKRPLVFLNCFLVFTFVFWSLELYLLIRANLNPVTRWGNPSTLGSLIYHITGSQFASFVGETKPTLSYITNLLWKNFNLTIIFIILGLWHTLKNKLNLFILSAVSTALVFYFLLAYIIEGSDINFLPFIPFGIMLSAIGFYAISGKLRLYAPVIFLFAGILQVYLYFGENNMRGDYQTKDYLNNLTRYIDKDTVIFTQGDADIYLESYGFKNIIFPLMLSLKWYQEKSIGLFPEIAFIREIEESKEVNKEIFIQKVWRIINVLRKKHPVVIINDKRANLFAKNSPESLGAAGLFYYLTDQAAHYLPIKLVYRTNNVARFKEAGLDKVYSAVHTVNASYYVQTGNLEMAKKEVDAAFLLNKNLKIREYASRVYVWLGNGEFLKKNYRQALEFYEKALSFTPENQGIRKNIDIVKNKI